MKKIEKKYVFNQCLYINVKSQGGGFCSVEKTGAAGPRSLQLNKNRYQFICSGDHYYYFVFRRFLNIG